MTVDDVLTRSREWDKPEPPVWLVVAAVALLTGAVVYCAWAVSMFWVVI